MSRHGEGFNKPPLFSNFQAGTGSEHEYCYEAIKKLVRNCESSKSDNSK